MAHRLWLACGVMAVLLSACGGTPVPPTSPPGTPPIVPTGQPLEGSITFAVFGDLAEKAMYEQLLAGFQQKYPQVRVQLEYVPGEKEYLKRLAADVAAGTPPDVVLLNYRRYPSFAAKGVLEPLTAYLAQSRVLPITTLYPESLAPFYFRGLLACVPQSVSSVVVYYNKNLFDQAGLPYPKNDWTWDDLLAAAQALTQDLDGDGRPDQYGLGLEPSFLNLAPFIWQNGGELAFNPDAPTRLSLDKPEAVAAMQKLVDLQVKYHVVPDELAAGAENAETRFLNGRLGMYLNSRRGVPAYRQITAFDWDVAPLPQGKQKAGILDSEGYCMIASSRNKAAAWALIEYAASFDGQTIVAAAGSTVPSLGMVAESPAFLDPQAKPAHSQIWLDAIPTLHFMPVIATWADVEAVVDSELERAFYGKVSVVDAIASAQARTVEFIKLAVELRPTPAANMTPGAGPEMPDCAAHVNTVPLVADFPADFPWPAGAVYLQTYAYPDQNGYYALGVVPVDMVAAVKFYQDSLPGTGYSLAPGDAEPGEIDLVINGNGRFGNLRAGVPLGCEQVTVVEVSFEPQPASIPSPAPQSTLPAP